MFSKFIEIDHLLDPDVSTVSRKFCELVKTEITEKHRVTLVYKHI